MSRKRDTVLNETLNGLEKRIDQCRVLYELWFNGIEKREPVWHRQEILRVITRLRRDNISNSVDRFRFRNIQARFNSLVQYWNRVALQRERSTYVRDVKRMKRRMGENPTQPVKEELPPEEATQEQEEGQEEEGQEQEEAAAASTKPTAQLKSNEEKAASGGLSMPDDSRMQKIYRTYLTAKERCNESTDNLSYNKLVSSLERQMPQLASKGYDEVDFKVLIKGGKAILRPVGKKYKK